MATVVNKFFQASSEFQEHFFQIRPDARNAPYGDVGPRQQLRRLMKCQSFDWYLKNVYPELALPSKESGGKNKTSADVPPNERLRRKYRRKNYVATYQVQAINFKMPMMKASNFTVHFILFLQIKLSGSDLCIESEKEVTSKGSTLVLAKCSRSKRQVDIRFCSGDALVDVCFVTSWIDVVYYREK